MKVVAHQTIRMHLPAGLFAGLPQRLKEPVAILVVLEDGVATVATVHNVIDRTGILNA